MVATKKMCVSGKETMRLTWTVTREPRMRGFSVTSAFFQVGSLPLHVGFLWLMISLFEKYILYTFKPVKNSQSPLLKAYLNFSPLVNRGDVECPSKS